MYYRRIVYCTPFPFRSTGSITEYFINNTEDFYLYLYPPSYKNQPTVFDYYHNGSLVHSEQLWIYKGDNKIIIHLFYYFFFLYFLFTYRVRNAYIIFHFPVFLFFNSLLRFLTQNIYVFWIWDYFPTKDSIMNAYNILVKHYHDHLQYILYLSPTIKKIYQPNTRQYIISEIVSFGIKDIKTSANPIKNTIGYIGNLRPGQGLEFILDIAKKDSKLFVEFVGDGPLREELEKFCKKHHLTKRVTFHGFVSNEKLLKIVKHWEVAVAPYIPQKDNPTMYTEPGKIKLYIELGLPVIMTRVSYLYKELIKYNAGAVIDFNYSSFAKAFNNIQKNYKSYKTGVEKFKKDNQFETYYQQKFKFLEI